jgi:hypothetical protein
VNELISSLNFASGTTSREIQALETTLKIKFPKDFVDFFLMSNGCDGMVGKNYLSIWPLDQILPLNDAYVVREFAPGLILFGSDGGEMAYGFDTRNDQIVEVPFIGMSLDDVKPIGTTFEELLKYLFNR